MESEDELVRSARDGDRRALVRLLETHGPAIERHIEREIPRRWRHALTGADVLQETYLDAMLDIRRFFPRGTNAFFRWLSAMARNNLRSAIEALEAAKRGGGRRQIQPWSMDNSLDSLYVLLTHSRSSPSNHAAMTEARTALLEAIEKLPEDHRNVVSLYDLQGQPIEEVAARLNRRAGAVYMLRSRAHRALRSLMGDSSAFF